MAQINFWQNSTPFFGATAVCTTKKKDYLKNEDDQKNKDILKNADNQKNEDDPQNGDM